MAKLTVKEIQKAAKDEIAKHPDGIRFAQLVRTLQNLYPETNGATIYTQVSTLKKEFPAEIVKPSRGLFQLATAPAAVSDPHPADTATVIEAPATPLEKDFYESFGNWLRDELDEVTHAVPLGGAGLKGKWGTPDVVGVYKSSAKDVVKFPIEVISAEVKIDPQQPVVAFGQAIAYRLFSHRSYIAMPRSIGEEDLARLESLCMLFGIGLALFDVNAKDPNYTISVRAQTCQPDAFYINQFAERLSQHDNSAFERLFG